MDDYKVWVPLRVLADAAEKKYLFEQGYYSTFLKPKQDNETEPEKPLDFDDKPTGR